MASVRRGWQRAARKQEQHHAEESLRHGPRHPRLVDSGVGPCMCDRAIARVINFTPGAGASPRPAPVPPALTPCAVAAFSRHAPDGEDSGAGLFGVGQFVASDISSLANWTFQMSYAATAATIDSGAVAERMRFGPYLILSAITTSFIYPGAPRCTRPAPLPSIPHTRAAAVVAHWVWNEGGWLAQRGFVDFAGSGVVHMLGGASGPWLAAPPHTHPATLTPPLPQPSFAPSSSAPAPEGSRRSATLRSGTRRREAMWGGEPNPSAPQ